ncbi:50S ribosomal protein 5 alpha, chloroplastic isoform X1 [Phoenix dactylifera]|uniref:50S ribosomal protein 5 alpha, chloroplastic isoform X1 n=1 Tax=Phoenix dactylifera TaxID=42345 RepID=A0A8B8IZ48_PHODC|nr:50S ribosomal protein 5 alpha, chloroplastic isoform X1 [Phoenix dactylifera]XP_026656235.2 50S ribosomal protein 5 alpha, chloroplastic isoform X1 [Phoenix dactylifera]XP_026656236.2 50S ribosomal protein 5 alpha, chloroplastic isoform X1 [Phoenix dactylifera]
MALLLPSLSFLPPSSPPCLWAPSIPIKANPCKISGCFALRLHQKGLFQRRSLNGVSIPAPFPFGEKRSLITRASSETDGNDGSELVPPSEGAAEAISVENLPLESKLQMMLEQKRRMKLAKKIRLRRKRLVRKRRMRKKGRWPPSKMKKNKNV